MQNFGLAPAVSRRRRQKKTGFIESDETDATSSPSHPLHAPLERSFSAFDHDSGAAIQTASIFGTGLVTAPILYLRRG